MPPPSAARCLLSGPQEAVLPAGYAKGFIGASLNLPPLSVCTRRLSAWHTQRGGAISCYFTGRRFLEQKRRTQRSPRLQNRKIRMADEGANVTSGQPDPISRAMNEDLRKVKFCSQCGQPTVHLIPAGDERARDVCSAPSCAAVHYANPKVVVGAICVSEGKVLLCKRAIEPCRGRWGVPQGFMELGESAREGAAREVMEEAGASAELGPLLAVYNVPGQVQLLYLGRLKSPVLSAGIESLETKLFAWDEIASLELAFPTVRWALDYAQRVIGLNGFIPQQRTKVVGEGGPSSGSYVEEIASPEPMLMSRF